MSTWKRSGPRPAQPSSQSQPAPCLAAEGAGKDFSLFVLLKFYSLQPLRSTVLLLLQPPLLSGHGCFSVASAHQRKSSRGEGPKELD